ncbi:MAG TPA: zinc-binding dehydrogenase, partial [Bacillota bacterium]
LNLFGTAMGNRVEFRALLEMLARGDLTPVVDSVMPFAELEQAFARLEEGQQFGKIVLRIAEP